ncbi:MAG: squalene cyclase [Acidimicrobiia bacterium]
MTPSDPTVTWLLDGDPAIRWQTHRFLLDSPPSLWSGEQQLMASEGWAARLLSLRATDGLWAGGLYTPKWTSTTYTLLQLWRMGLSRESAEAKASTELLMAAPVWVMGPNRYWETCVAGFGLVLSSWFEVAREARETLVEEILAEQMDDGGWNCRRRRDGAHHSSFHTTMNVIEGLREYCIAGGEQVTAVEDAEARARDFFCAHHLYRSHRSDDIPDPRMRSLPFPPRWHHDILRGLDYFRSAGASRDARLEDPVDVLLSHRRQDGKWPVSSGYSGEVWFKMESGRLPSRWNTLRSLRVLRWWSG